MLRSTSRVSPPSELAAPLSPSAPDAQSTDISHSERLLPVPQNKRSNSGGSALEYSHNLSNQAPSTDSPVIRSGSPNVLHRRRSRLSRLSSLSRSQPSTPSSSIRPESRPFTLTSASSVPFIVADTRTALPPNKLVKRSPSANTPNSTLAGSSFSRRISLRGPATSHQRSATLSESSAETNAGSEYRDVEPGPSTTTDSVKPYKHYFSAELLKPKPLATPRNKGSTNDSTCISRVYAQPDSKPALVLANSVAAAHGEADHDSDKDSPFYFGSRPTTPSGIAQFFSSPSPAPLNSETPDHWSRARRSFSINDLFSHHPPSWKLPPDKSSKGKLRRKTDRRFVSAPDPDVGSRPNISTSESNKPAPLKRPDIEFPVWNRRTQSRSDARTQDPTPNSNSTNGSEHQQSSSPSPTRDHASSPVEASLSTKAAPSSTEPVTWSQNSRSPNPSMSSKGFADPASRHSRYSAVPSEIASSHLGSDNGTNIFSSGDEDDGDFRSDTVYDSLRTGATRSNSGFQGLDLETLFNKEPASHHEASHATHFRNLMTPDSPSRTVNGRGSLAEDEESVSTPVRTVIADDEGHSNTRSTRVQSSSTPPLLPQSLHLGKLEWDTTVDTQDPSWSEDEEEPWDTAHGPRSTVYTYLSNDQLWSVPTGPGSGTHHNISQKPDLMSNEFERKTSVFDWSEQQPIDRSTANNTPPRPKTVHGKKDTDGRGSRSTGRRAPSGLHARSQSVPVVADLAGKRSHATSKFGTWGIGTKGVTEDWNEDFDFNEESPSEAHYTEDEQRGIESGMAIFVPATIREQQSNVLANIGLLREWGLLIEELKELRMKAASLGILNDRSLIVFNEVDAMIQLADQEAEDDRPAGHWSVTSSPGFDLEDVGEAKSLPSGTPRFRHWTPDDDVFGLMHQGPRRSNIQPQVFARETPSVTGRPRKGSEAAAKSVIEALQQNRSPSDPILLSPDSRVTKKVPFDTATLKNIVPYVNGLKRKVKQVLRDAEGLNTSPHHATPRSDPLFSQAFIEPESPSASRERRAKRSNGQNADNDEHQGKGKDLVTQLKLMTMV